MASLSLLGCGGGGVGDASDAGETGGTGGTGGIGGIGGTGGGAGGGGAGGVAGNPQAGGDCVDFSHAETLWGDPRNLRIVGSGVEAHEGDVVRLIITIGEPHYGLAETTVESGAFEFTVPGGVGNYTGLGIYIDKGKDDACTLGVDPFWQMSTGGDHGEVRWNVYPGLPPPAGFSPCSINGIFDLTKMLPCPS